MAFVLGVVHIRTIAAGADRHGAAERRDARRAPFQPAEASAPAPPLLLLGEQRDGAVAAPTEKTSSYAIEVGVFAGVLDERPVAADAGDDRLSGSPGGCRSRAAAKEASVLGEV